MIEQYKISQIKQKLAYNIKKTLFFVNNHHRTMCRVSLQEVDGLPLAVVEHVRDLLFRGGPEPLTVRQHQMRHAHIRAGACASTGAAGTSALP